MNMETRRSSLHISIIVQLLVVFCAVQARASSNGTISGIVFDRNGNQPIPGVLVWIVGTELGAKTDSAGRYAIHGIPTGKCDVRTTMIAYRDSTADDVSVFPDQTTTIDFQLAEQVIEFDGPCGPIFVPRDVQVFFATDNDSGSGLEYGICKIGVPRHGIAHEPVSPGDLDSGTDLNLHPCVVYYSSARTHSRPFFSTIADSVRSPSACRVFVYVQRSDISFRDAARLTAQISEYLGGNTLPIFYRWPSQGISASGREAHGSVNQTAAHLSTFLKDLATETNAPDILIIADGAGSRVLSTAYASLLKIHPELSRVFGEITLIETGTARTD